MNSIKLILFTSTLITSHTFFGMGMQSLRNNLPKKDAYYTWLALKYLNAEDQEQFFAAQHTIKDSNLGKSDPTPLAYIEKAIKIKEEKRTNYIRKRRKTA